MRSEGGVRDKAKRAEDVATATHKGRESVGWRCV